MKYDNLSYLKVMSYLMGTYYCPDLFYPAAVLVIILSNDRIDKRNTSYTRLSTRT